MPWNSMLFIFTFQSAQRRTSSSRTILFCPTYRCRKSYRALAITTVFVVLGHCGRLNVTKISWKCDNFGSTIQMSTQTKPFSYLRSSHSISMQARSMIPNRWQRAWKQQNLWMICLQWAASNFICQTFLTREIDLEENRCCSQLKTSGVVKSTCEAVH